MDSGTIVLKNIRRDIPALKPLAAKVICLQKELIEAVKRYQELKSKPVRDEAAVQELLNEILKIDQSQREQLNLVRETENSYTSLSDIQEDVLYCTENLSSDGSPVKSEDEKEAPEGSVVDFRITGNEIKPKPVVASPLPDVPEAPPQEPETVQEEMQDDGVMNWEDLTREQWTETDKLLQKVERVGSRVLQPDFLSTMDLVHVAQFQHAQECMTRRKLHTSQGKRVTTGPWQIFDVPTKVTNRRCNYLASGLHVTVRQKDPQRSIALTSNEGGMKTRHQDSRGSSRTSSRASSPVSTQTDSFGREHLSLPGKSRTMTTRASKVKRVGKSANNATAPTSTKTTNNSTACATSPKSDAAEGKTNGSLEPCVTYTLVDGFPHFKVFFPSSKDSTATPTTTTTTSSSNRSINTSANKDSLHPPLSIVESGIEIIRPVPSLTNHASHMKHANSFSSSDFSSNLAERNAKLKMAKSIKRPRLAQGYVSSSNSGKSATSVVETAINPIDSSDGNNCTAAAKREDGKEEVGLCLEKCGSWMGAPHFKIYRTFPSVNSTSADWTSPMSSPIPTTSSSSVTPPNKTTLIPMAPKLSTTLSTPRLAAAPIKPTGTNNKMTAVTTLPKMPKLTMGNTAARNNLQQSVTMKPPSTTGVPTPTTTTAPSSKLVPIAPKLTPGVQTGAISNFVLVPFADKNQQGSMQANQQAKPGLKRPISLLKTCSNLSKPPSSATTVGGGGGQLLTVKGLKECLQHASINYKDKVKVVVQKVPMPNAAAAVPSQTGQKFAAQPGVEDVKKKGVKPFTSPAHHNLHHHHRHSSDKESIDDSQTNIAPTVIVADMSA